MPPTIDAHQASPSPTRINEAFTGFHQALDKVAVQAELARLPVFLRAEVFPQLLSLHLTRHKPGRRCLIEYSLLLKHPSRPPQHLTLMAKIRMKSHDHNAWAVINGLWQAGINQQASDAIMIPSPMGEIPHWHMLLQPKVPGLALEPLLAGPQGEHLAMRVAAAAHNIHRSGVPTQRHHTITDELNILHKCLSKTAHTHPQWAARIERVIEHCKRLGKRLPHTPNCGIHRDLYADQIIVDGDTLYLLDFDLYCLGNPALDIGNFIAHISEFSVRKLGNANALSHVEHALTTEYLQLNPSCTAEAIDTYTTLSLARHIYISTLFTVRRPFTQALLELTEQRLAL